MLSGCSTPQATHPNHPQLAGLPIQSSVQSSSEPITFFQNPKIPTVKLALHPDPLVMRRLPTVLPPKTPVFVYLPLYLGATSTRPVSAIGDMGTPLDGDLVDGILYFKSKNSQEQITSWYTKELKNFGYTISGHSQSDFEFTKSGHPGGNPTQTPDINLGFLPQKQGDATIFKLKASYIVTPTRPKDSYLPSDVVKVVVTNGKSSKTILDKTWINKMVQMINDLQVSTPGISGGMSATAGGITTIDGKFYDQTGSVTNVEFSMLFWRVRVGNSNVTLNSGPSPALTRQLESVFTG